MKMLLCIEVAILKGTLKLEGRDPETVLWVEWLKENLPYFYANGCHKPKSKSEQQKAKRLQEKKKLWTDRGYQWDDEEQQKYKPCTGCEHGRVYKSPWKKCNECVTSI